MKISILIPVLNEAKHLPRLFKALSSLKEAEIVLVDNKSEDGSLALLTAFAAHRKNVKILTEARRGFAEPLNRAVSEASGEILLFLDADATPSPGWLKAMIAATENADLVVGETVSAKGKLSPYGKLSAKLFHQHSRRASRAEGHALPWGPTCNLAVKKVWFENVGPFSSEAAGAFDIDFCWRAVLAGARIAYAPKAVVMHERRNERDQLLQQFDRYGLGEAWLHRTYSFLLGAESKGDPLQAGVEAFTRLRHQSSAAKVKSLALPLEEVAVAFASGVRLGYERPHRACPLERPYPAKSIGWWMNAKEMAIFVPGKGLTSLMGKPLEIWLGMREGKSKAELTALFQKLFRIEAEEAGPALDEFIAELSPAVWQPA